MKRFTQIYAMPVVLLAVLSGCVAADFNALPESKGVNANEEIDVLFFKGTTCKKVLASREPTSTEKLTAELAAVGTILFDLAYSSAKRQAKKAVSAKLRRFNATWAGTYNEASFSTPACIVAVRQAELKDSETGVIEKFETYFPIDVKRKGSSPAFFLEADPKLAKVEAIKVSSNLKNRGANISVSIALSFVDTRRRLGPDAVTVYSVPLYSAAYSFEPEGGGKGQLKPARLVPPDLDLSESALMPYLPGLPVTIAVSVAERGNGAIDADGLKTDFDANADFLKKILDFTLSKVVE